MGMAASQARLLCITARIHDVEYQAQAIQHAKVQLATRSDEAYSEYLEALDATTLTINSINPQSGEKSLVTANFNTMCSRNRVTPSDGSTYLLKCKDGIIVEDEVFDAYYDFNEYCPTKDPYLFAMYMIAGENGIGALDDGSYTEAIYEAEESVYNSKGVENPTLKKYHEKLVELAGDDIYDANNVSDEDLDEYNETLAAYRAALYKDGTYAPDIQATAEDDTSVIDKFDSAMFKYYAQLYKAIQQAGGCISISEFDGPVNEAANNSEWLQAMVQSGQITIEQLKEEKDGDVILNTTSPSSDTCLAYTATTTIDSRAMAKAEAKYEKALKDIDKKDKAFDLSLSKLETERTALTTEYDSVKKVIEDNIDRTFGIFS